MNLFMYSHGRGTGGCEPGSNGGRKSQEVGEEGMGSRIPKGAGVWEVVRGAWSGKWEV